MRKHESATSLPWNSDANNNHRRPCCPPFIKTVPVFLTFTPFLPSSSSSLVDFYFFTLFHIFSELEPLLTPFTPNQLKVSGDQVMFRTICLIVSALTFVGQGKYASIRSVQQHLLTVWLAWRLGIVSLVPFLGFYSFTTSNITKRMKWISVCFQYHPWDPEFYNGAASANPGWTVPHFVYSGLFYREYYHHRMWQFNIVHSSQYLTFDVPGLCWHEYIMSLHCWHL